MKTVAAWFKDIWSPIRSMMFLIIDLIVAEGKPILYNFWCNLNWVLVQI